MYYFVIIFISKIEKEICLKFILFFFTLTFKKNNINNELFISQYKPKKTFLKSTLFLMGSNQYICI